MTNPDEEQKTDLGPKTAMKADILGYILAAVIMAIMFSYSSAFR